MAKPRPPPKRQRGKTPYDDKQLIEKWRSLEAQLLKQGYSEREAHEKIAAMPEYNTTRSSVYCWLRFGRGSHPNQKARPYTQKVKNPKYRRKDNFARRFVYEPSRFVVPIFRSEDEAVTLDELTSRLHAKYDYTPRRDTLRRLVNPHPRTGAVVLVQISDDPPLYRLTEELYQRVVRDLR